MIERSVSLKILSMLISLLVLVHPTDEGMKKVYPSLLRQDENNAVSLVLIVRQLETVMCVRNFLNQFKD